MHKTEQRRTNYTGLLDRTVEQKGSRRKPQYLDVALARDSKRVQEPEKNVKTSVTAGDGGGRKLRNKVELIGSRTLNTGGYFKKGSKEDLAAGATATKGDNTSRKDVKVGTGTKSGKVGTTNKSTGRKSPTFQEKKTFQSKQNQKLYQELDHMLGGDTKKQPLKPTETKPQKKEPIASLTKNTLYPGVSQETKNKFAGGGISGRYPRDPVAPLPKQGFLGSNSETWHNRELKAKQRLASIEQIDDFKIGDFSPRLKLNGANGDLNTHRSTGVRTSNINGTRHIVADIPIYVPTLGNQAFQPFGPPTHRPITDRAFETTVPGVQTDRTYGVARSNRDRIPEAFTHPVPISDTPDTTRSDPALDTYRHHVNPISERLFLEKVETERNKFAQENQHFFDGSSEHHSESSKPPLPPDTFRSRHGTDPVGTDDLRGKKKPEPGTLISDPGPRRSVQAEPDDSERYKFSPSGYVTETKHKRYIDREADMYRRDDEKRSSWDMADDQRDSRAPSDKGYTKYGRDSNLTTTTGSRGARKYDSYREDSWVKDQLDSPARGTVPDTYRVPDQTGRGQGHRDQTGRGQGHPYGNETYRADRESTNRNYRLDTSRKSSFDNDRDGRRRRNSIEHDRDGNRSYQMPSDIKDRERYSNFRADVKSGEKDGYSKDRDVYDRNASNRNRYSDQPRQEESRYDRDNRYPDRRYDREQKYDREQRYEHRYDKHSGNERDRKYDDERKNERRPEPSRDSRNDREPKPNADLKASRSSRDRDGIRDEPVRERDAQRSAAAKSKASPDSDEDLVTRRKDSKVEYVLRKKSGSSGTDFRKSQMSQKSEPPPDNIPPPSTELPMDRSVKSSQFDRKSVSTSKTEVPRNGKVVPESSSRQTPIGSENKEKPPTFEPQVGSKPDDELNKYFDVPEKPESPSNTIPFYSDNASRYSKQKGDFRNGELMTPVQETSIRTDDDSKSFASSHKVMKDKPVDPYHRDDRKAANPINEVPIDPYERDDRPKRKSETDPSQGGNSKERMSSPKIENISRKFPPTSTENKFDLKEERKSPWKKDDQFSTNRASPDEDGYPQGPNFDKLSKLSRSTNQKDKTEDTKGRETLQDVPRVRKENTVDSQGPTQDKEEYEEVDIENLNLDEIETEMDEQELYLCYMMTDNGETIGPMRLDINDVQVGLPKPLEKTDEGKKQGEEVESEGMRNRQTGSHGLNEFSSRSHSMLMLTIDSEQQDPEDENLFITKRGKLTFVDLAGSEKVKDSNSTADTLVESNSINKSLLVLGNCISSLGDHKRRQGHIPYRDSKLTKLLADSLGGNGVTLMICCVTPSSHHASETMNTLRYASRAKKIRTKPVIKMDPREKLILSLKKEIKVLRNENHYLRQQRGITKLDFPAKPRGQLQKENDQKFVKLIKETNGKPTTNNTVNEKIKQNGASADESGLYEMLQEYMVENESLRTENADLQVGKDKVRQEQQLLYRDNEKLMKRVDDLERKVSQAQTSWQSMPRQGSHPENGRSRDHSPRAGVKVRDHSPRGSPQYNRGGGPGSGGRQTQPRLPPPPADLPLNPALRDPVYPGSPPQGYASPTGNSNKGKPQGRGQPMKPPHRLNEPIGQQRPVHEQNGPYQNGGVYMNGHPPGPAAQYRQTQIGSPNRASELRMDSRRSSQSSSSDAIRDMNEKLKQELMQLEGEIHHHTALNSRNVYGSQGSMR